MSVITNIVLLCELDDQETVEQHLTVAGRRSDQTNCGGDKVFCKGIFFWAQNYLLVDEFLAAVEAVPWKSPSAVMLIVEHEDECCPAVYRLGETGPYSHNPEHEWTLGELMLDEGERLEPRPKLVKVVKARAD